MAKRLAKRTATTKTKTKEAPEPETLTCEAPVNVAVKGESSMGKCIKCNFYQANSRVDNLCFCCNKEANGYVLNEKQNRYVTACSTEKSYE